MKIRSHAVIDLTVLILAILAVTGWVMNIVKFASLDFAAIDGMMILRGIGIFMAPLGSVLGYF
jgi:hypothetical protein